MARVGENVNCTSCIVKGDAGHEQVAGLVSINKETRPLKSCDVLPMVTMRKGQGPWGSQMDTDFTHLRLKLAAQHGSKQFVFLPL